MSTEPLEPASRLRRLARSRWVWGILCVVVVAVVLHGENRSPSEGRSGAQLEDPTGRVASTERLRIASFNIHHGVGLDGRYDLERVAETLEGFDVVGLNEVTQGFTFSQAQQLSELLEMGWAYAPAERRWWRDHWGNALLSRYDVHGWESVPLPGTRGKGYRCYVEAQIPWRGQTLHVIAVHIDRRQDRERQLQLVADRFLSLPEPAILMGDLNTQHDPTLQRLLTHPGVIDPIAQSNDDIPRIDWILARGLVAIDAGFRDIGASDHPCVWAEFELPETTSIAEREQPRTTAPLERR